MTKLAKILKATTAITGTEADPAQKWDVLETGLFSVIEVPTRVAVLIEEAGIEIRPSQTADQLQAEIEWALVGAN